VVTQEGSRLVPKPQGEPVAEPESLVASLQFDLSPVAHKPGDPECSEDPHRQENRQNQAQEAAGRGTFTASFDSSGAGHGEVSVLH
jgi:hypothetical protein